MTTITGQATIAGKETITGTATIAGKATITGMTPCAAMTNDRNGPKAGPGSTGTVCLSWVAHHAAAQLA